MRKLEGDNAHNGENIGEITYPVPFLSEEKVDNISISANTEKKYTKKEIISKAYKLHVQGNILEAEKAYIYCIENGFENPNILSNYAVILQGRGKTNKAKKLYQKAIEYFPNNPEAYSNLGVLLSEDGELQKAEELLLKAIKINPKYKDAYVNLSGILQDLGRLEEAEISINKAIELDPNNAILFSNLSSILRALGRLDNAIEAANMSIKLDSGLDIAYFNLGIIKKDKDNNYEANKYISKALEINPNYTEAYANLGVLEMEKGDFEKAELLFVKSIEIKPDYAKSYYDLSTFNNYSNYPILENRLLKGDNFKNIKSKENIYILFAKANLFHKKDNFSESSKNYLKANDLKLSIYPSNFRFIKEKSAKLLKMSNEYSIKNMNNNTRNIFILGMPRSGTTLVDSIITMNQDIFGLGERNILEKSFLEWQYSLSMNKELTLAKLYSKNKSLAINSKGISTDKWLYNYQYSGLIASLIPDSRIIHCIRNPLDNILSIYRTNFSNGNQYSSSLIDCARIYLDHEKLMNDYKSKFPDIIYTLNYDKLVSNPDFEIRNLIGWLGFKWNNFYFSPQLNPRSVSTASNFQVRSPINSKSIGGWKKYRKMLEPAIEVLQNSENYKNAFNSLK